LRGEFDVVCRTCERDGPSHRFAPQQQNSVHVPKHINLLGQLRFELGALAAQFSRRQISATPLLFLPLKQKFA
jgi:hypothetical protein